MLVLPLPFVSVALVEFPRFEAAFYRTLDSLVGPPIFLSCSAVSIEIQSVPF